MVLGLVGAICYSNSNSIFNKDRLAVQWDKVREIYPLHLRSNCIDSNNIISHINNNNNALYHLHHHLPCLIKLKQDHHLHHLCQYFKIKIREISKFQFLNRPYHHHHQCSNKITSIICNKFVDTFHNGKILPMQIETVLCLPIKSECLHFNSHNSNYSTCHSNSNHNNFQCKYRQHSNIILLKLLLILHFYLLNSSNNHKCNTCSSSNNNNPHLKISYNIKTISKRKYLSQTNNRINNI
mmetsp:Transcript_8562/g.9876  ORF Transcript_8562/g.9876 Transcript_8562/m.9876 type:complete len:239 (+) Transcript_8562:751-1467(+)